MGMRTETDLEIAERRIKQAGQTVAKRLTVTKDREEISVLHNLINDHLVALQAIRRALKEN